MTNAKTFVAKKKVKEFTREPASNVTLTTEIVKVNPSGLNPVLEDVVVNLLIHFVL